MKTDKQIQGWLKIKIENYKSRIGRENSYGSKKKLITLLSDLRNIADQMEKYINEKI